MSKMVGRARNPEGDVVELKNYIFIVLDGLRFDVYDDTDLDFFPNEALKAYSAAAWTVPSFVSMLLGWSPINAHRFPFDIGPQGRWLPTVLRSNGYLCRLHSGSAWLAMYRTIFDRGFHVYDVKPNDNRTEEYVDNAEFSSGDVPFFDLFHLLDTHTPTWDGGERVEFMKDKEDNWEAQQKALKFDDECVGEMLSSLPDGTVVTMTSDHGDAWGEGEPPSWGHNPNPSIRKKGYALRGAPNSVFEVPYVEGEVVDGEVEWFEPDELRNSIEDNDGRVKG